MVGCWFVRCFRLSPFGLRFWWLPSFCFRSVVLGGFLFFHFLLVGLLFWSLASFPFCLPSLWACVSWVDCVCVARFTFFLLVFVFRLFTFAFAFASLFASSFLCCFLCHLLSSLLLLLLRKQKDTTCLIRGPRNFIGKLTSWTVLCPVRDVNFLIKFRGLLVKLQLQEGSEAVLDLIFSFLTGRVALIFCSNR